jgi:hypothetical protein
MLYCRLLVVALPDEFSDDKTLLHKPFSSVLTERQLLW